MLKRIRGLFGRRDRDPTPDSPTPTTSTDEPVARRHGAAEPGDATSQVHRGPRAVHRPIPEKDLDPDAVKIIRRLARFDHIAYLVGGCVRDLLLDHSPKDFDIATSATPRQVKRAFRNCRIIGRRFRLAHIYFQDGKIIEVATFRAQDTGPDTGPDADTDDADGAREDADILIRDDNVFGTPEEDALRRDFTINQLFYDLGSETVLDHAGGLEDLRHRVVRTIGDPEIRFREDPIRILRAIKFAARLDLRIEDDTLRALERVRFDIERAAPPRVLEEINRFCRGGAAVRSFELLRETNVFDVVLPEYHEAYADDGPAWTLLRALLERIDRSVAHGREISTGEILASLVLPQRIDRLGWDLETGRATRPRGVDARRLTDDLLRPIAMRLRVARRDQERARQIVMSLFRMVPAEHVRANTRRAILSRECFADALGILHVLAERFEGQFAEAFAYWSDQTVSTEDLEAGATTDAREAARTGDGRDETGDGRDETGDGAPRRRRRRRRGRGSGRAENPEAGIDSERLTSPESAKGPTTSKRKPPPSAKKPDKNLPSVWDDQYFFAALPKVPAEIDADTDAPFDDRSDEAAIGRDAATVDPRAEDTAGSGTVETASEGQSAGDDGDEARPRRRRRRRRRGGRSSSSGADSSGAAEPES